MNGIYELLRGLQVGFQAPTVVDKKAVLQQYPPLADNLAQRLLHLDAKLNVLVSKLQDQMWAKHGHYSQKEGWFVENKVFA